MLRLGSAGPGVGMGWGRVARIPEVSPVLCPGPQQYLPSICSGSEGAGLFGDTKKLGSIF